MKKILSHEPIIKSRMPLIAAAYVFALLFSFFASYFVYRQNLGFVHFALLQFIAFLLPLILYKQAEVGRGVNFSLVACKPSFIPRLLLWILGISLISFGLYAFFLKPLTLYGASFAWPTTGADFGMLIISFVFLPTVCEELLIRGAWQTEVEKESVFGTVLVSALMSASFGFQPYACLYLFLSGIFAAMVKLQSGSTYASLIFSLLWRAVFLLAIPLIPIATLPLSWRFALAAASFVLGIIALFFAFDRKAWRLARDRVNEENSGSLSAVYVLCALAVTLSVSLLLLRFLMF